VILYLPATNGLLRSTLDKYPVNTAALVGTESVLNCSATTSAGDFLTWSVLDPITVTYNRIYNSLSNNVVELPGYNVNSSAADGYYNLIIPDTNANFATKYECALVVNNTRHYASVVAVGKFQRI